MINVVSSSRYKVDNDMLKKHGEAAFDHYGIPKDMLLNIVVVGKRKMRDIANTYKQEDVALPVLSFPYTDVSADSQRMLGEVFLCYPQIVLLAAERQRKLDVMFKQLIDHGVNNLVIHV